MKIHILFLWQRIGNWLKYHHETVMVNGLQGCSTLSHNSTGDLDQREEWSARDNSQQKAAKNTKRALFNRP